MNIKEILYNISISKIAVRFRFNRTQIMRGFISENNIMYDFIVDEMNDEYYSELRFHLDPGISQSRININKPETINIPNVDFCNPILLTFNDGWKHEQNGDYESIHLLNPERESMFFSICLSREGEEFRAALMFVKDDVQYRIIYSDLLNIVFM